MSKKPLKSTDRRRNSKSHGVKPVSKDTDGAGPPLASLFNDRRRPNGAGKKAF